MAVNLPRKMRVAMAAWEIGRTYSGLGTKIGGLGVVVEELPPELLKAALRRNLDLEVVTLSPCFGHYDRRRLAKLNLSLPVTLQGQTFNFEAYECSFADTLRLPSGPQPVTFRMVYFWDEWQLRWTNASAIYPNDPQASLRLYSAVSQAMAGYIKQQDFQVVHLHDYHVGLVPFFLGDEYLQRTAVHLTIHNASYQGVVPLAGSGADTLSRAGLPGGLYRKYFDFFNKVNLMRGAMLKVHESDGHITTVSGNLEGTWGYAGELRENQMQVFAKAWAQKGCQPNEVFLPNRGLDLFEKLPILGITNGLRESNLAEQLPELRAAVLKHLQSQRGQSPLFANPAVQQEMLASDHNFDAQHLELKQKLRRLLYLEAFNHEPFGYPVLLTAVGRLVEQKNFGMIAEIIPRTLDYDNQAKFIILASPQGNDSQSKGLERHFFAFANRYPGRVYFNNGFNQALAKLILAGGDFTLVPSRFEPCGLVDYEAALLANIPIARATGGLPKIRHCGYLYDWLDIRDPHGEANVFFAKIKEALDTYRNNYARHQELMRNALATDASWDASANQYLDMYRFGLLVKHWRAERAKFTRTFAQSLGEDRAVFNRFFMPKYGPQGDDYDWQLKSIL